MKTSRLCFIILVVSVFSFSGWAQTTKSKPKISMQQARQIALAKEPGTIQSAELETEKGRLVYSFDIKTAGTIHEVQVDAMTGKVLEDSVEDPATEAQEKQQEAKKKSK